MKSAAVFMDRDGTLNEDTGYVRTAGDVRLIAGAGEAVRLLNEAGFKVVLVTNQPGVARGSMSIEDVDAVNERLCELLAEADAHIDGIYYCPHLPDGTVAEFTRQCNCRKPKPGMLLTAAEEMELDLESSFMVGDSPRDMQAGQAVGARTILIDRGATKNTQLDIARTALEAAERIIEISGRTGMAEAAERARSEVRVVEEAPRPETAAKETAKVEELELFAGGAAQAKEVKPLESAWEKQTPAEPTGTEERRPEDIPVIRIHGVRVETPTAAEPAEMMATATPAQTVDPSTPLVARSPQKDSGQAGSALSAEEKTKAEEIPVITHMAAPVKEQAVIAPVEPPKKEAPVVKVEERAPVKVEPARETATEVVREKVERPAVETAKRPAVEEVKRVVEKKVEKRAVSAAPVNCGQCGSMIPDADVEMGRALVVDGKMLCRECHIYQMARTTQAHAVGNAEILAELKNITRTMAYEPFSVFNIFGGLAQMGTFAALVYSLVTADASLGLQLAIVLQLMALTFFVLGKQ